MKVTCKICLLPEAVREEVNRRLRYAESLKSIVDDISTRYVKITVDSLARHRKNHLSTSELENEPDRPKTGTMDVLLPINVHYVLNKIKDEILDPNYTYNSDQEHLINTIILEKVKQQLSVSILVLLERYNQQEAGFPKDQFQAFKIIHGIIKDLSRDQGDAVLENTIKEKKQTLLKNMQRQKIYMDAYRETAAKAKKYKKGKIFGDYLEGIHADFKYASGTENLNYKNGFKKWCKENPDHPLTKDYCLLNILKVNMGGYNRRLSQEWVDKCMAALSDGSDDADNVVLELKNEGWTVVTDVLEEKEK
jgi:hypothetical protein